MHPRLVSTLAAIGIAIEISAAPTAVFAQAAANAPPNLAAEHVEQMKLGCNACHGDKAPMSVSPEEALTTVNQNCVNCHGDTNAMAAAILPKLVHKDINPHASHLVQIDCVTCHHGHTASEAYCLQCHAFDMKMPPTAKK
jgi:fumarate reductase flavoprotein subunit